MQERAAPPVHFQCGFDRLLHRPSSGVEVQRIAHAAGDAAFGGDAVPVIVALVHGPQHFGDDAREQGRLINPSWTISIDSMATALCEALSEGPT